MEGIQYVTNDFHGVIQTVLQWQCSSWNEQQLGKSSLGFIGVHS